MQVRAVRKRGSREIRAAAERRLYALAADLAVAQAPDAIADLAKFRTHMEVYERLRERDDWRRALDALAAARAAAIAAGFPELESVVTHRLFDLVRERGGRKL